jgi:hypothetical protein
MFNRLQHAKMQRTSGQHDALARVPRAPSGASRGRRSFATRPLRRRRGGNRLTDRERDEIRRCTRDPDSLRWPRGTDE